MSAAIIVPKKDDQIHKEECVLCFKTAENKIWCCTKCFEGFCSDHFALHSQKIPSHSTFLTISKTQKKKVEEEIIEEAAEEVVNEAKLAKLEIPAETPQEYEYSYGIYGENIQLSDLSGLIDASDAGKKPASGASDAWTEPSAQVCEHTLTLCQDPQEANCSSSSCSQCELKSNLWKCLTCGALSCGRRQFDGSGGYGHAFEHSKATGHHLVVKLGTILEKADGLEADVYCYKCDDAVLDPELSGHLFSLGIDAASSRKTEKSLSELNLTVNLTHSYSMTDAGGSDLKELSGPWMRGFTNLGNSCYIAAVIQSLRNLDSREFLSASHNYLSCSGGKASECLQCQLHKLYLGLESEDKNCVIRPWMFKRVAAGSDVEFNSGRQQDASEFLSHLLQNRFSTYRDLAKLSKLFEFEEKEELWCTKCEIKRERSLKSSELILNIPDGSEECSLDSLISAHFSPEPIEWRCDLCEGNSAMRQCSLTKLPKYLTIVINRLKLKNWVPEKVDCRVSGMNTSNLSFSQYFSTTSTAAKEAEVEVNSMFLEALMSMGFDEFLSRNALVACKNSSIDDAIEIIYGREITTSHPDEQSSSTSSFSPDPEAIEMLTSAGFSEAKARESLTATNGDLEQAFEWIFAHPNEEESVSVTEAEVKDNCDSNSNSSSSYHLNSFITHKGSSMHCGHYVSHLSDSDSKWILFNDEKVAEAKDDDSFPIKDAYIYMYKMNMN